MERKKINLCKVLIIGKSGAGKSSFCNYIFGRNAMKVGNGKPVTGWSDNFNSIDIEYKNLTVRAYDTVGIEPDNFPKWEKTIKTFIEKNQPNVAGNTAYCDWLQGVFLLINASSGRIENIETEIINLVKNEYKTPLHVILTNCDVAGEEKIRSMERELSKYSATKVLKVCSETKRYRTGNKEAFGKEAVLEQFVLEAYKYSSGYIALKFLEEFSCLIEDMRIKSIDEIEKSNLSIFNLHLLENILDDLLEIIEKKFEKKFNELENFKQYLDDFNIILPEDPFEKTLSRLDSIDEILDVNKITVIRKFEYIANAFSKGGLLEKVGAVVIGAEVFFNIKQNAINAINELCISMLNHIIKIKNDINVNNTQNQEFEFKKTLVIKFL